MRARRRCLDRIAVSQCQEVAVSRDEKVRFAGHECPKDWSVIRVPGRLHDGRIGFRHFDANAEPPDEPLDPLLVPSKNAANLRIREDAADLGKLIVRRHDVELRLGPRCNDAPGDAVRKHQA